MGGGSCVIIIEGNVVQGRSAELAQTAAASCQLVDYLEHDVDIKFDINDAKPIQDFHIRVKDKLAKLNDELDGINRALAAKYNRTVG